MLLSSIRLRLEMEADPVLWVAGESSSLKMVETDVKFD